MTFGILLLVSGLIIGSNTFTRYRCNQYERLTGTRTEFSEFDICYIELEDKMVRWDEYLERVKASEILK